MKIVKIILGVVVVLVLIVGVLSFILPKEMTVERSIVINAPREQVYEYLRITKNQEVWSPWWKADPSMRVTTQGVDGEVGYKAAWAGNSEVGVGEQEIMSLTPNERIDSKLRFKEPMEGDADAWFITQDAEAGQTKVTWGFHSVSKPPFHVFCYIFNKLTNMMNKTFDQGLTDLKTELEKGSAAAAPDATAPTTEPTPAQ